MRLLIITQKADRNDPILGFFHRWLEEFARNFEHVTVIAQSVGAYELPTNVEVLSLGKQNRASTLMQVCRFWRLVIRRRRDYDAVLVHMTPVWVLLGGLVWKVLRKPIYLWYEIKRGGWKLSLAHAFSTKIFCATPHGLPKQMPKAVVTGHGIDTEAFCAGTEPRDPQLIVSISRITRIKKIDVLLRAFATLPPEFHFTIAGGTITRDDEREAVCLRLLIDTMEIGKRVRMIEAIPHEEARALLQKSALLLHACGGGLDKVVLEAMACECPVVSSSDAAISVLPSECQATEQTMGDKAKAVLTVSLMEREELGKRLREIVVRDHSLPKLIVRLRAEMA